MIAQIEQRRAKLEALCHRFQVRCLEVFGSTAEGEFRGEESDLDFLVEFEPLTGPGYADRYFGLLESLAALCGWLVNLVFASAINKWKPAALVRDWMSTRPDQIPCGMFGVAGRICEAANTAFASSSASGKSREGGHGTKRASAAKARGDLAHLCQIRSAERARVWLGGPWGSRRTKRP
ncbi:MAG: hypothetical protein C4346_01595 [Chloroflexota bacterium]